VEHNTKKIEESREPRKSLSGSDGEMKPLGETLLDFFSVITRWRRFISWFVLSTTVVVTIITFFSPKWYKSTASVFPAEQAELFPGLEGVSSFVKSFSGAGSASRKLGSLTGPTELDRYTVILKSDRVFGAMIRKFDLVHVYDYATSPYAMEKTAKELADNSLFETQDEGYLTITVYDKVPARSAEMANYFVEQLNMVNAELKVENARGNREFIEQRYNKNLDDLRSAEDSLRSYQEKSGMMMVPDQTKSGVSAIAELYGMKAKKEIELAILERTVTRDNSTLQHLRIELSELNKKIGSFPQTAVESFRLYRDVAIQQKIAEFLVPLFEQAKVEEHRSTPSVVVLDYGGIPERKAKPKVSLYTLLAFVISSLVAFVVIFSGEALRRLRALDPERYGAITATMRSDWFGLRLKGGNKKT